MLVQQLNWWWCKTDICIDNHSNVFYCNVLYFIHSFCIFSNNKKEKRNSSRLIGRSIGPGKHHLHVLAADHPHVTKRRREDFLHPYHIKLSWVFFPVPTTRLPTPSPCPSAGLQDDLHQQTHWEEHSSQSLCPLLCVWRCAELRAWKTHLGLWWCRSPRTHRCVQTGTHNPHIVLMLQARRTSS